MDLLEREQQEVFKIDARRCKRCGGLLTSKQGLRDGYGPCCLQKLRTEERQREEEKRQYSLFAPPEEAPEDTV